MWSWEAEDGVDMTLDDKSSVSTVKKEPIQEPCGIAPLSVSSTRSTC